VWGKNWVEKMSHKPGFPNVTEKQAQDKQKGHGPIGTNHTSGGKGNWDVVGGGKESPTPNPPVRMGGRLWALFVKGEVENGRTGQSVTGWVGREELTLIDP